MVDLLQKFIHEQATLGGPFDGPDAFFEAMQDFLDSKKARKAVANAWIGHMVDERINSGLAIPMDEVFTELRKRAAHMLDVRMREETRGITSDEHAICIILDHIRDVESSMGGLQFDTFEGTTYMHRIVERVIQVVSRAVWVVPTKITDNLNQNDLARLKKLEGLTPTIGEPLSAAELWEVVTDILPRLERALKDISPQTSQIPT